MPDSPTQPRVVLAGGSGFLGRAFAQHFHRRNWDVVVLTRRPSVSIEGARAVHWDGTTLDAWKNEVDGAALVVNLNGKSVNCRYTPSNTAAILSSRLDSVRVIDQAIAASTKPPPLFVQAGSLAIYGDSGDAIVTDDTPPPPGTAGFATQVCRQWEDAFNDGARLTPATRRIMLRIGFALGPIRSRQEGGGAALGFLVRLTKWGLGGRVGDGRQFISWLHLDDLLRIVDHAIATPSLQGVINTTCPNPVTNDEFMRILRRVLHRPWSPPVPAPLVALGCFVLRTEPSLALTGRRCIPTKLDNSGFRFQHTDVEATLRGILVPQK